MYISVRILDRDAQDEEEEVESRDFLSVDRAVEDDDDDEEEDGDEKRQQ